MHKLLLLVLTMVVACRGLAVDAHASPAPTLYEQFYEAVATLQPDPSRVAQVTDLVIRRDVGTLQLGPGTLTLCQPIAGRTLGALYRGAGRLQCLPPTRIEREQLARFTDSETLDVAFESLFLVFADTTMRQLSRRLDFEPGAAPDRPAMSFFEEAIDFLHEKDETWVEPTLMRILLNGDSNEFFQAHASPPKGADVFFVVDPDEAEEVRILREADIRFHKMTDVLAQFECQADRASGRAGDFDRHEFVRTDDYVVRTRIGRGLDVSARAEFRVRALRGSQSWFPLHLSPELEVRGAHWQGAGATGFFKGKDNPHLWIEASPPLQPGEERRLVLEYDGDILLRDGDWTYLKSSIDWYPRSFSRESSVFDLTFDVPKDFTFVSVGRKVSEEEIEKNVMRSRWVLDVPSRNASFNIGFYERHEIRDDRIPPVTVLMNRHGHRAVKGELMEEGVTTGKNMERQVGADVANALAFFQHVYGPCPTDRLWVTDIPTGHGEAFPGLINLSWSTFQNTDTAGYDEIFRAHEVAHQWWGFGVDHYSYHDQWLAEGFAEYSGIWYMQEILQDNDKFFARLREWRDDIFDNRKFLFGKGLEAGPISLGIRTASSQTASDYDLIIYKKGAWVLHMLRNLMIDLNTLDESVFLETMQDFYTTYRGRQATTDDFRAVVEAHLGMDMQWFFDQWVDGTDLPRFQQSWHTKPQEDGTFIVRMVVRQMEVPETFRTYVPIRVDFANGQFTRLRVHLIGPVSEFDLPPLPLQPERIVFNDMESVLCRVE